MKRKHRKDIRGYFFSKFICNECGIEGIPIIRRKQREKNHIKDLYCINCKYVTKHTEIRNIDEINKGDDNMYANILGEEINESEYLLNEPERGWSFNLKEDTIESISYKISQSLEDDKTIMCNIQIPSEYSQFDVLFSLKRDNQGYYQGGVKQSDLIIAIMIKGAFGFKIEDANTEAGYYQEKLGCYSKMLTELFNKIRQNINL